MFFSCCNFTADLNSFLELLIETTHILLRSMHQYSAEKDKITIKKSRKKVVKPLTNNGVEEGPQQNLEDNDSDYDDSTEKVTEEIWRESETTYPMFAAVYSPSILAIARL
jgi:hypothetical protein